MWEGQISRPHERVTGGTRESQNSAPSISLCRAILSNTVPGLHFCPEVHCREDRLSFLPFRNPVRAGRLIANAHPPSPRCSNNDLPRKTTRLRINRQQLWEIRSAAGGNSNGFAASSSGGARPQTAEIIKTFGQRCPEVIVNGHVSASDYVVELDHEGGKAILKHKDKDSCLRPKTSWRLIFSESTYGRWLRQGRLPCDYKSLGRPRIGDQIGSRPRASRKARASGQLGPGQRGRRGEAVSHSDVHSSGSRHRN